MYKGIFLNLLLNHAICVIWQIAKFVEKLIK